MEADEDICNRLENIWRRLGDTNLTLVRIADALEKLQGSLLV